MNVNLESPAEDEDLALSSEDKLILEKMAHLPALLEGPSSNEEADQSEDLSEDEPEDWIEHPPPRITSVGSGLDDVTQQMPEMYTSTRSNVPGFVDRAPIRPCMMCDQMATEVVEVEAALKEMTSKASTRPKGAFILGFLVGLGLAAYGLSRNRR